jgi:hypothetical protein
MQKAHSNINWKNYPSDDTALNASNLNKMDNSIDEIDNRIITYDTTKFNTSEAQLLVKGISFNKSNGVFTVTYYNGTTFTIDTLLEKLAVNFDFDAQAQQLIIVLDDGTKKYVDLSALITQYEFLNSDTIGFTVNENGKVTANVVEGSIQEKHLRPDYLADIKVVQAKAQVNAEDAKASADKAEQIEAEVKQMQTDIDTTVNESLLAKSEEILEQVQNYYERAEALYNSLYIDLDGGNCAMRRVDILAVDCGNCATRVNDNGIYYDGGDFTTRLLGE